MAIRSFSIARAFLIGAAMVAAVATGYAAGEKRHPGRVVELGSQAPTSAEVKAWAAARKTGESGNCPEFGEAPVDAQISDPKSGDFSVKVPGEVRTYTMVYCVNGYHRRVDRHIPNDEDGTAVIPLPAFLQKQSETAALEVDPVRFAVFALNRLAYLYDINAEAFQSALQQYAEVVSEEDGTGGQVLAELSELVANWAGPE